MTTFTPQMSESERSQILSPSTVRRVWIALTATPQASYRDLSVQLDMPVSTIHYAIVRLRDAGYLAFEKYGHHNRTIIVPLHTTGFRIVKRDS